ncbi:MAG: sel1 repeat family protein [Erysipelotrichaceae bacterium]|nr:sel1 repeat family protein [Erysipelotrichaceae bacterium]
MFKQELQHYFENQPNIITGANNLENEKGSLNSILKKYDLADGGYYKNALAYKKSFLNLNSYILTPNYYYSSKYRVALYAIRRIEKSGSKTYLVFYDDSKEVSTIDDDALVHVRKIVEIREKYLNLGHKYVYGDGVEKNIEEGKKYYRAAFCADYNPKFYSDCFVGVGNSYYNAKKYVLAQVCYQLAAEWKNSIAYYNLCLLEFYGLVGDVNHEVAREYALKSLKANSNYLDARYMVAFISKEMKDFDTCYTYCKGINDARFYSLLGDYYRLNNHRDYDLSRKYYVKAIEVNPIYYGDLALLEHQLEKYNAYFFCMKKAVEAGNNRGYNNLAYAYENGLGVEQDYEKAHECYRKYIEYFPNEHYGYNNLGYLYLQGKGCEVDYKKAFEYFTEGVKRGSSYSKYHLAEMHFEGQYVNKDIDKGMMYLQQAMDENMVGAYLYYVSLLLKGKYVEKDEDKAFEVLKKAIDADSNNRAFKELIERVKNGDFGSELEDIYRAYDFSKKLVEEKTYLADDLVELRDYYFDTFTDRVRPSVAVEDLCSTSTEVIGCYYEEDHGRKVFMNPYTLVRYVSFEDALLPESMKVGDLLSLVLFDDEVIYGDSISESDLTICNPAISRIQSCRWHLDGVNKDPACLCEQASVLFSRDIHKAFEYYRCAAIQDYYIGYLGMADAYVSMGKYHNASRLYKKALWMDELNSYPKLLLQTICRYLALAQADVSNLPDDNTYSNYKLAMKFIEVGMDSSSVKIKDAYNNYMKKQNVEALDNLSFCVHFNWSAYGMSRDDVQPVVLALECYSVNLWKREHEEGNKTAAYKIAHFYYGKNLHKMQEWNMVTYDRGDADALYNAAHYPEEYGLELDDDERFSLLKSAARKGNYNAQAELSNRADELRKQLTHLENVVENHNKYTDRELKDQLELVGKNIKYTINEGPSPSALKDIFKD